MTTHPDNNDDSSTFPTEPTLITSLPEDPDYWSKPRTCSLESDGGLLPLQFHWIPAPSPSDELVVTFHGALDRARENLPRFERVRSLSGLRANRLYLSDPTLLFNENVRIGWYLGSETDDVTERYGALIRHASRCAVADSRTRTILTGTSGGGFAAMATGPRIPRSLAVVFSPQTNIGRFGEYWTRTLMKHVFPGMTYEELEQRFPERTDIATLFRRRPGGRVWYVQNSGDTTHTADHELPLRRNSDERFTFVSEFHAAGHTAPTTTRVRSWLEYALENFWGSPHPHVNP